MRTACRCHETFVNKIMCDLVELEMACNVSVQGSHCWPSGPGRGCWTQAVTSWYIKGILLRAKWPLMKVCLSSCGPRKVTVVKTLTHSMYFDDSTDGQCVFILNRHIPKSIRNVRALGFCQLPTELSCRVWVSQSEIHLCTFQASEAAATASELTVFVY